MQKVLFFSCTFPLPLSHHEIVLVGDHLIRNKCCSYSRWQVLWKNQRTEDLNLLELGEHYFFELLDAKSPFFQLHLSTAPVPP